MTKTAVILFGATGDLAKKKLYPALYGLHKKGVLKNYEIICVGRREFTTKQIREAAKINDKKAGQFFKQISYVRGEFHDSRIYSTISAKLKTAKNVLFYLATPYQLFGTIAKEIQKAGLSKNCRVIFEKPFGHDLESAKKLNDSLRAVFDESQIYRIDHYLGKDIIQNILVLRFTNSIIEHLCNNNFVDNVQITVSENAGIEERGNYYDKTGALRDMVQNHLLQMLSLIAMEPPCSLSADAIRDEKVKVLSALHEINTDSVIAGQYTGYISEPKVEKNSKTETFVALKAEIHNLRWGGVPFYLRTGKKMAKPYAEINIVLKDLPCVLFCQLPNAKLNSNRITIRIQPEEKISIQFNSQVPGKQWIIMPHKMEFCHSCEFGPTSPKAYENLIEDALESNQTLFTRWDEVENSWKFIDKITNAWHTRKNVFKYKNNYPKQADQLLTREGRAWINE